MLDVQTLEKVYGASFAYPNLYEPRTVIDGKDEETIEIITQNQPHKIIPAIWGMLPSTYEDEWSYFQSISDTLNLTEDILDNSEIYKDCLASRRCIIPVSGFFIYYLHKGILYPFYVYDPKGEPLHIAGVYTNLKDGFCTVSMLTVEENHDTTCIQNVEETIPLLINRDKVQEWLSDDLEDDKIHSFFTETSLVPLSKHPVAREFFRNDITYDSILDPVAYRDLPVT